MLSVLFTTLLLIFHSVPVVAQRAAPVATLKCPLIPDALAKLAASHVAGHGRCGFGCRGCGCLGGPGYRSNKGRCVGYKNFTRVCGPPPHRRCHPECATTIPACADRGLGLLLKLATTLGLSLHYIPSELAPQPHGVENRRPPAPPPHQRPARRHTPEPLTQ
ncbi:MAG: hypothetical protein ACK5JT_13980 [Hyphomicrobiaceae bacterium]